MREISSQRTKASAWSAWSSGRRFDSISNNVRGVEPVKYCFSGDPGAESGKRQSSSEHTDEDFEKPHF
jgi:hypothetical protein